MTKDQEDKLNMYETVDGVLQGNDTVWTGNSEFSDAVDDLEDDIEKIGDLAQQQMEDITGITEDKHEARIALEEQIIAVASIIVFWASRGGGRGIVNKVNFGRSELSKARDNEITGMAEQVHEVAADNAAVLVPFGLTPAMITALADAITEYNKHISKPREALTETSAATEQLPPVFRDTDKILEEQLDKGMELFKVSEPDFYTQYFNARIIVNSPTQKRALEVTFTDMVTNAPLFHVSVVIDDTIKRRSSKKGNIRVQNLAEGSHTLEADLPGYEHIKVIFNVIAGETTKLVVKMIAKPIPG